MLITYLLVDTLTVVSMTLDGLFTSQRVTVYRKGKYLVVLILHFIITSEKYFVKG